jgi:hypothetical protein
MRTVLVTLTRLIVKFAPLFSKRVFLSSLNTGYESGATLPSIAADEARNTSKAG